MKAYSLSLKWNRVQNHVQGDHAIEIRSRHAMQTSEIETITLYCFEKSQQNSKEHQITSLIDFPNAKYAKFKGSADVFRGS